MQVGWMNGSCMNAMKSFFEERLLMKDRLLCECDECHDQGSLEASFFRAQPT